MKLPFKKLYSLAKTPTRAHHWDAGYDLYALSRAFQDDKIIYQTGIAVDIPPGYAGLLFARSSVRDTPLILANAVAVIDSGYHGDLTFSYRKIPNALGEVYALGDKCGQILIVERPSVEWVEVPEFVVESERGIKGHGSSGA